jgi:hypothetical protein
MAKLKEMVCEPEEKLCRRIKNISCLDSNLLMVDISQYKPITVELVDTDDGQMFVYNNIKAHTLLTLVKRVCSLYYK